MKNNKEAILNSQEYKDTKKTCQRNLTGNYNVQTLRYALLALQEKHGDLAVALLISEVPDIAKVVTIPNNIERMVESL